MNERLVIKKQANGKTGFKHVLLRQRRYRSIDQPVLTNQYQPVLMYGRAGAWKNVGFTVSWVARRLEICDFCSPFENIKFSLSVRSLSPTLLRLVNSCETRRMKSWFLSRVGRQRDGDYSNMCKLEPKIEL